MNTEPLTMQIYTNGVRLDPRAEKALERGIARIEKWTERFPRRNGHVNLSRRERDGAFRVEVVLELPHKTIVAHDEVPNLVTAIDRSFRRATRQLREFKAVLRRDHLHSVVREVRTQFSELQESELSEAARQRDLERFKEMSTEYLGRLRRFLLREIAALKVRHPHMSFSVDDLVEETLATALDRFDEKPWAMPSYQWLYGVALDVLENHVRRAKEEAATQTIEEEERDVAPTSVVEEVLDEFLMAQEILEDKREWREDESRLDEQMAGNGPEDPAKAAERGELQQRVLKVLGELPRSWRRSFLLHFMEGFDFPEVALMQNLPEDQVRSQIESAELFVRERLAELAPGA